MSDSYHNLGDPRDTPDEREITRLCATVAKLRQQLAACVQASKDMHAAQATTIAQLRQQLEQAVRERDEAQRQWREDFDHERCKQADAALATPAPDGKEQQP